MNRKLAFAYGVICYAIFFGTFLYAIGFLGNLFVPRSVDAAPTMFWGSALAIDTALLGLFALQHSVMARPGFKRWWTRYVPEPVERSTYVLFSSLALILTFGLWQPLGGQIWSVQSGIGRIALYSVFGVGWLIVLVSTFMINHFDLFGLRQVWLYLVGKPYVHIPFRVPGFYKFVRHPLYIGWFTTFWATPDMTLSHLVFALLATGYILSAIPFEERDLVAALGHKYAEYRASVPKFIPRPGAGPAAVGESQSSTPGA